MSLRGTICALALLLPAAGDVAAQAAPVPVADSYETTFDELMGLRYLAERVATVDGLVLQREAGRFTVGEGKLYLLSPIGGRTVAAELDLPLMPAEPKRVKFNDLEGVLAEVKTVGWED